MVEVEATKGGGTVIREDGFTLHIHPDGRMYAQHPCTHAGYLEKDGYDPKKAALLFSEILEGECMDCGEVSLPERSWILDPKHRTT